MSPFETTGFTKPLTPEDFDRVIEQLKELPLGPPEPTRYVVPPKLYAEINDAGGFDSWYSKFLASLTPEERRQYLEECGW